MNQRPYLAGVAILVTLLLSSAGAVTDQFAYSPFGHCR